MLSVVKPIFISIVSQRQEVLGDEEGQRRRRQARSRPPEEPQTAVASHPPGKSSSTCLRLWLPNSSRALKVLALNDQT